MESVTGIGLLIEGLANNGLKLALDFAEHLKKFNLSQMYNNKSTYTM